MRRVYVWDPFVRLFHWSVVAGVALAFLTEDLRPVHKAVGFFVMGAVVLRVAWGFLGPRTARFADFVRSPAEIWEYLRAHLRGEARPHLGHNPLGGMMVVALLTVLLTVTISGWMMTLDAFWGVEWVEDLHEAAANSLFLLVPLHLFGVVFSSLRERVNLVKAMITGYKEFAPARRHGALEAGSNRAS